MGITGILPHIAEHYSVSLTTAGLLVSGFALVVAIAGPTMPLLFSKVNRRLVMLLATGAFTLSTIVSILAPNFTVFTDYACFYQQFFILSMSLWR